MKLHVTQVGGCQRLLWHAFMKHKRLPPHILAVRGILSHAVIERALKDQAPNDVLDVAYPSLLKDSKRDNDKTVTREAYDYAIREAMPCLKNFDTWTSRTIVDIESYLSEKTLEVQLGFHTLSGTPDLYTEGSILDFKTGKPRMSEDYKRQLGGYKYMLEKLHMGSPQEGILVFLGGEFRSDKSVKILNPNEMVEARDKFEDALIKDIDFIEGMEEARAKGYGEIPQGQCKFGIKCAFCSYRDKCNGF